MIDREFAVGVSKLSGFIEWVTEGKGEIEVVLDAESQALKWQSMIVLERQFYCEIGWQHGYIRPIDEYILFFGSVSAKGL